MNISNIKFNIKPLNITENQTKYINILNNGIYKLSILSTPTCYELILHNTTNISAFNPTEGYNYWIKRFDTLEEAEQYAEEVYLYIMNKFNI